MFGKDLGPLDDVFDAVKDVGGGLFGGLTKSFGNIFKGLTGSFGNIFSGFLGGGGDSGDSSVYIEYGLIAVAVIVLAVLVKKFLF